MNLPADFTFDSQAHRFALRGEPVPSVTEILKGLGFVFSSRSTQFHMDRGTAVHAATAYLDQGTLDESSLDPRLRPYLSAYKQWKKLPGIRIQEVEVMLYNPTYRYAGILDRVISYRGKKAVLDIKTGQPADWHSLQLVAYALCFPKLPLMFSLYLREDGEYRFLQVEEDPENWRALVRTFYRRRNK